MFHPLYCSWKYLKILGNTPHSFKHSFSSLLCGSTSLRREKFVWQGDPLRGIFPRELTLLSVTSCCHRVSFTCKSEVPVPACFSPLPLNIWPQKPWESDSSNWSKLFCISLHRIFIYGQKTSGSFKTKMCWWSHCRQQIISCRCWNKT